MSASWVAAATRGLGLTSHRLGPDGAETLARQRSLSAALESLAVTSYGRDIRDDMGIAQAQHAVSGAALWQMRILAGWSPALGAAHLRAAAARFEISNIVGHLCSLRGEGADEPFSLGTLATAWRKVRRTTSVGELRRALALSTWGDPGEDDIDAIRVALELAWAKELAASASEATGWASAWAALVTAKVVSAGVPASFASSSSGAARHAGQLIGRPAVGASSIADLAAGLPPSSAWVLEGIADPSQLWIGETRWWHRVDEEAATLSRSPRPSPASVLGCCMLLAADAWRVNGALELAARGGGSIRSVLDAAA